MPSSNIRFFHLHLVSDATGETLNTVGRAATAHFSDFQPVEHIYALIRTPRQLQRVLADIERQPGIVLFTVIDRDLRRQLEEFCRRLALPCISILDPVISIIGEYLNAKSTPSIGRQHALTAEYFRRIDALNFTMTHDDGQHVENLEQADVVLIGISRTSKTPTSIYLAQRGIRTANVPIVFGLPLPQPLVELEKPLVVGLIASAERIAQIRRQRLISIPEMHETPYTDPRQITDEIVHMKRLCSTHNWPLIDVTRRSVEEVAAAVINLLSDRNNRSVADNC